MVCCGRGGGMLSANFNFHGIVTLTLRAVCTTLRRVSLFGSTVNLHVMIKVGFVCVFVLK